MTWDASQQHVRELVCDDVARHHGPTLVYGGPGSGKTSLAEELAVQEFRRTQDLSSTLVLTPSREASTRLGNAIEAAWMQESDGRLPGRICRTFSSYAHAVLGRAAAAGLMTIKGRTPRLIQGAEQDSIIREILGELPEIAPEFDWPDSLHAAATADGFRKELREFFDRAAEYGLAPETLERLAKDYNRPEWQAGAMLYRMYEDQLDTEQYSDAYDPAGLIVAACHFLERYPEFLAAERAQQQLIVIDDLQEANPIVHRLLRAIGRGKRVIAFANPHTAVQGFRGARPDKLRRWNSTPPQVTARLGEQIDIDADTHLILDEGGAAEEETAAAYIRFSASGAMGTDDVAAEAGRSAIQPQVTTLTGSYRLPESVQRVYGRVAARLAPIGPAELHRLDQQGHDDQEPAATDSTTTDPTTTAPTTKDQHQGNLDNSAAGQVSAFTVTTGYLEEQAILEQILDRFDAEPDLQFSDIAVISRSGHSALDISRSLSAHGIPTTQHLSDVVLTQEPAVAPLLHLMHLSLAITAGEEPVTAETAQQLLTSRAGAATPQLIRTLRQQLLAAERQAAMAEERSPATGNELLAKAVTNPQDPVATTAGQGRGRSRSSAFASLHRIAAMLAAGVEAAADEQAGPEQLLWQIWNASGLADEWAVASHGTGAEAQQANRDLDAVIALFGEAERFATTRPGASAAQFLEHMDRIELPMDTLAAASTGHDAVEVLTPATAAGREFDTVILASLQDGTWPNLTPRGALLHTGELIDVIEGRTGAEQQNPLVKRLSVLQDEYRIFATALSRARRHLIALAVESHEELPSRFMDLICPPEQRPSPSSTNPVPATASVLIAQLRRRLEGQQVETAWSELTPDQRRLTTPPVGEPVPEEEAEDAACAMSLLARTFPAADPAHWWGLRSFATGPATVLDEAEPIRLTPSRLEALLNNPLQWYLDVIGGRPPADLSRMLGTLVHAIAEDYPDAEAIRRRGIEEAGLDTADEYTDSRILHGILAARWHTLRLDPGWEAQMQRRRAELMLTKLSEYYRRVESEQRRLEHSQEITAAADVTAFSQQAEHPVQLVGRLDRVEFTEDNRLWLVDLKTGRATAPRKKDMHHHPQLGAYQLLAVVGAVHYGLGQDHHVSAEQLAALQPPAEQGATAASGPAARREPAAAGGQAEDNDASGSTGPSAANAAVDEESPVAGAALVQLGRDQDSSVGQQDQLPYALSGPRWPETMVAAAVADITGDQLATFHGFADDSCRADVLCPLCAAGGQVTQR